MLSTAPIEAPEALMSRAAACPRARALIVGADTETALVSARAASDAGLIEPVLIGDLPTMQATAEAIGWDIAPLTRIQGKGDAELADAAARAVADPAVQIVMKGQVHTDALMAAMIRRSAGVHLGQRMSHVFHMTVPGTARPLLISDAVLTVAPKPRVLQSILQNLVRCAHAVGIERPKVAVLSATEEAVETMPSSVVAAELAAWSAHAEIAAEVDGPLALDNAIAPEAVRIKGMTGRTVAGHADAVVVPNIETGNVLFKALVWYRSACAAGVVVGGRVPIIITSRADPPVARLASAALAALMVQSDAA